MVHWNDPQIIASLDGECMLCQSTTTLLIGILRHRYIVQAIRPRERGVLVSAFFGDAMSLGTQAYTRRWEFITSLDFELKVLDKRIDRKLPNPFGNQFIIYAVPM